MKKLLHSVADYLGTTRVVRSLVSRVVYPVICQGLLSEVRPDESSPSGLVEALAWKGHAYYVLENELRQGQDCAAERMRSDGETRNNILQVVKNATRSISGDVLEFGVAGGASLRTFAATEPERMVYGFDCFEGLPEAWWTRPKGAFKSAPPQLDYPNVRLVIGLFEQTVPEFLESWTGEAALIHVDCDLYSSTRASLLPVLSRAKKGTIVLFDEYYNYPGFAEHEWRAWQEARQSYGIRARCIAYDGRRAAFQILSIRRHSVKHSAGRLVDPEAQDPAYS